MAVWWRHVLCSHLVNASDGFISDNRREKRPVSNILRSDHPSFCGWLSWVLSTSVDVVVYRIAACQTTLVFPSPCTRDDTSSADLHAVCTTYTRHYRPSVNFVSQRKKSVCEKHAYTENHHRHRVTCPSTLAFPRAPSMPVDFVLGSCQTNVKWNLKYNISQRTHHNIIIHKHAR